MKKAASPSSPRFELRSVLYDYQPSVISDTAVLDATSDLILS